MGRIKGMRFVVWMEIGRKRKKKKKGSRCFLLSHFSESPFLMKMIEEQILRKLERKTRTTTMLLRFHFFAKCAAFPFQA